MATHIFNINVYTMPSCSMCDATKNHFDKLGIPYSTIDLTKHPDTLLRLQKAGYKRAPVVEVFEPVERVWSGYNRVGIEELGRLIGV